jgi:hypothetical protein
MKTATIIHRQTPKNLALPFTQETGILQPDRTGSRSGVATAAPVQKPLTFALAKTNSGYSPAERGHAATVSL